MPRKAGAHPLTQAIEGTLARLGLSGSRGLLAVSGGADSMALLHATARIAEPLGLTLEVATVDHGLRPEAAAEVTLVQAAASSLGVVCHARRVEVGAGPGLEARARILREATLETVREERALDWIATAHTANDQAETLLMRLGRGAGLRGAAAILERRGAFVRPMLGVTRVQVESALREWGVAFAQDPMNADPSFLRVRIRSQVMPALRTALGNDVTLHLAEFAQIAAEDEAVLEGLARDALKRLLLPDSSLDAAGLRALLRPLRARVFVALLERERIAASSTRVEGLEHALWAGGHYALTRSVWARAEGGTFRITRGGQAAEDAGYLLAPGDPIRDTTSGLELQVVAAAPVGAWSIPVQDLALPLTIRRRRPGDRVSLPGGQTTKLQDVLVDAKVPAERRGRLPIVVSAQGAVLAVAGLWPRHSTGPGRWHLVAR